MENDYDFMKIMKSYEEFEDKNNSDERDTNQFSNLELYSNLKKSDIREKDPIIFSNMIIQTSFDKIKILKKMFYRHDLKIITKYFLLWRSQEVNVEQLKYTSSNLKNFIDNNSNLKDEELPHKIARITYSKYDSSTSLMNNLNVPTLQNDRNPKNARFINHNDCPDLLNYNYINELTKENSKQNVFIILPTKFRIENLLKNLFNHFIMNCNNYINSRKSSNSSLSLLYLFTQLAITKNKVGSIYNMTAKLDQFKYIIEENKRKIAKYEECLSEKADIIATRNDKIEQQIETIELLTEEINRLNEKIEKLEKKGKNLNVITESLCHKCSNSLEESFIKEPSTPKRNESSLDTKELRKTIHEQLEFIVKIEKENRDLKLKNLESRDKNQSIMKELEEIKNEFKFISESYVPKVNVNLVDNSVQTQLPTAPSTPSGHSRGSETPKKANNKIKSHLKCKSTKYTNTLNLHKNNATVDSRATEKNITNYNIKNFNSASKLGNSTNSTGSASSIVNLTEYEKETIQSLRFDNAIISQEIISLNKELNKIKIDNKSLNETAKKIEKEKNELVNKFKSKSENLDKIKKENEELMILIQTSNYKSFISVETENKKLKSEYSNVARELEAVKEQMNYKDKKLSEYEIEFEKLKKILETFNKFKSDRENLILSNAKLESELKRISAELEDNKIILDKQNIILKNKEEIFNKMSEEINYLNFYSKKLKQEAEISIQDAIAYQQIVRKIEKDLKESQMRREKVENELVIIKKQLGIMR